MAEGRDVAEPTCDAEAVLVLTIELVKKLVVVDVYVLLLWEDIEGNVEGEIAVEKVVETIEVLEGVSVAWRVTEGEEVTENVSDG